MYVFVCNAQAMGYNTVSHTYYVIGAGYYEYGDNHHNHCIGAARRRAVLHGYKLGTLYNATIYDAGAIDGALVGKIALYYLLFTAVFTVSGYFSFEKADLK